jgi:cation:H+ antiporter
MATGLFVTSILAEAPLWPAPLLAFGAGVFVVLSAASWFTSSLEALSDRRRFSPGLLGLLGALGANVPNYAASLTVSFERQAAAGQGIIVGSNIFNVAIILALVVFAAPARRGIALEPDAGHDVLQVAWLVLAMAVTTLLTIWALVFIHPPLPAPVLRGITLVTLGLFALLTVHAMRRDSRRSKSGATLHLPLATDTPSLLSSASAGSSPRKAIWSVTKILVALALTLGGVVILVQAGQALAADVHLPSIFFSLVVLAIATSLPNAVVAYQLTRTHREVAAVEEILSSNGVNLALGSALPLLLWPDALSGQLLLCGDAALMVALQVTVLLCVQRGKIARTLAGSLLLIYLAWVLLHVLL